LSALLLLLLLLLLGADVERRKVGISACFYLWRSRTRQQSYSFLSKLCHFFRRNHDFDFQMWRNWM